MNSFAQGHKMQKAVADFAPPIVAPAATGLPTTTVFPILFALSFCHMLNDMMQSLISALFPMIKADFNLDYGQIGLITLAFQLTASLLQPLVGTITDKRPMPYSISIGMGSTLIGLVLLSQAHSYGALIFSAAMVGVGSAVFHPESSRVARAASGGRFGLAQSLFQVGGNAGSAIGPLMAAWVVLPRGQGAIAWFSGTALLAMLVLFLVGNWYSRRGLAVVAKKRAAGDTSGHGLPTAHIGFAIFILVALLFSKNVYSAALGSYYTFYLIEKFHLTVANAQVLLFVYMGAVAAGTLIGGPVGDRIGRKAVMWVSILGVLPFTLILPHVGLEMTVVLTVIIGLIMASSFPAILVYAQDLLPGRVGMVSGIFFGFAFGLGGLGAAALGRLADVTSIEFVYQVTAFLPAIGVLIALLPTLDKFKMRTVTR
jgi:FSR family fosmidomycin resistance protein-like MFS transporter